VTLVAGASAAGLSWQKLAAAEKPNPFAYDLTRLSKTDPTLIRYEQAAIFSSRHSDARRIVTGPRERFYIAAGNYVIILDHDGTRAGEFMTAAAARCIAVAADETIYTGVQDHVEVFTAAGKRLAKWDAPDGRPWFTGLAATENDLFVADSGNRVILRYDRSGKLLGRIGDKNPDRNVPGLVVPSPYLDVKITSDGLLHVNNTGRHRIETYTVDGDFEGSWGKASARIDGFCGCCNPIGIAVLPDGGFVTCEKGLPRVKVYSSSGVFQGVVAGPEAFPENTKISSELNHGVRGGIDAAVDAGGTIYLLDLVLGDIRVMKPRRA
jgi:hypothetical protein